MCAYTQVVFTWQPEAVGGAQRELASGALVRTFSSEGAMLRAWHEFFDEADPDAISLFQACLLLPPNWLAPAMTHPTALTSQSTHPSKRS